MAVAVGSCGLGLRVYGLGLSETAACLWTELRITQLSGAAWGQAKECSSQAGDMPAACDESPGTGKIHLSTFRPQALKP